VRYIFIDEAGISANEPISVVVGIIVDADKQCATAEEAVNQALNLIPQHKRASCPIFSAKKIWGDKSLRDNWSLNERMDLLNAVMSIPRNLCLALAIGACRRTTQLPANLLRERGISLVQAQHGIAFQECIARADSWITKYARYNEKATAIAEDVPESKQLLRHLAKYLLNAGYSILREDVRLEHHCNPMLNVEEFRTRKISRIRLPIHFVEKQDEPLLQISDACAFGFRRFLSKLSRGEDFARAILGNPQRVERYPIDEWGGGIFSWGSEAGVKASYAFG
jgi:hypothetical protein